MSSLHCEFEFSGYSDYWGGRSGRGIDGGIACAFYGKNTTLRDLVDQWVDDVWSNDYDFEGLPDSVSSDDIRDCILAMLTDSGRADYESGAICEFSLDWMSINDIDPDSDDDDWGESPVAYIWISWDKCPDCGELSGDDTNDGLCDDCHRKHYTGCEA